MTLQEAKDQIAKEYGYKDWQSIDWYQLDQNLSMVDSPFTSDELFDEAAELYARSKWDEGREEQRALFVDYLLIRHHNVLVTNIPRPEFKP